MAPLKHKHRPTLLPMDGPSEPTLRVMAGCTGAQHAPVTARAHQGTAVPGRDWRVHCLCLWSSGAWGRLDDAVAKYAEHYKEMT